MNHLRTDACRACGGPVQTVDTRKIQIGGVPTVWRRKRCSTCMKSYKTAEIPLEVAEEVWAE